MLWWKCKELALPKLSQLEKLLKKVVHSEIELNNIRLQQFDDSKVPCLIAIYEDGETQKPRAVAVLDIYAVCVLASANPHISPEQLSQAVHKRWSAKRYSTPASGCWINPRWRSSTV